MEFALYRYEFEVMEKKDSSTSLFPDQWDNLSPRQAFDRKSELLDKLLEMDYQMLTSKQHMLPQEPIETKTLLPFFNKKKPLYHQYVIEPKGSFAILQLARLSSVSRRPRPFQAKAEKEDDYRSQHIIIDNRGTHQHVAIEVKNSVFRTDTIATSLTHALSEMFARYGLGVKVVPMREDTHFWKVVGDKERYPKGFKSLLVEFPQINDPEVSKGLDELGIGYHRQHFGTGLSLLHKSPQGENIPFDENDDYQRTFMHLASTYGDNIKLMPVSGPSITFGGECAKTGEIPDTIMQSIRENQQSPDLFDTDAKSKAMEYMNKLYTRR